jgi:hypothetical protein
LDTLASVTEVVALSKICSRVLIVGLLGSCALVAAGPLATASGSATSIKEVLKNDLPKITAEEGKFLEALAEYEKTGNPEPVESSLDSNIKLLQSVRSEISKQSAGSKRVRTAKLKLRRALGRVIGAYRRLKVAFGVKGSHPKAAKQEAKKALKAIKKADGEMNEAAALLGGA